MNHWKKKFLIIWTGQLFSIFSSYVAQFAIILWISIKTGSAEILSFATIAGILPLIIIGPFAGVFVDRWSRKWTMIGADAFIAICSALMALLFHLDMMPLWAIYTLLMLRAIGSAFHAPAMKASVPLLAPKSELNRIAGINQSIQSISSIGGPVMGAILIASFDMAFVMLLDVVGAIIACTALLFVRIPNPPKSEAKKNVLKEMKEGFMSIRKNHGLSWVMCMEILSSFFILPIVTLIPLMTIKQFSGGAYEVSFIEMLFGLGTLLGGVLLGIWNPKMKKVFLISGAYFGFGFAYTISGMLPSSMFLLYAAINFFQGIALPFYAGPFTALLQTQIASEYQGRAFAFFDSISLLPSLLGLIFLGTLADSIGIPTIFIIGGLATALSSIILICIPSVRKMN